MAAEQDPVLEGQVRDLAHRLVAAFASGDLETYFSRFAEDATFAFHTSADVLTSVHAYREVWDGWVRDDGFEVLECRSSEPHWQVWHDGAVLLHRVSTTVRAGGTASVLDERETIVFQRSAEGWLAVHEHLSVHPAATPGT